MNGDFTRDTFHPEKHYSRVVMQQGRVQLESDSNEQAEIFLRTLRRLAADLIGPFGGPGDGFKIDKIDSDPANDPPSNLKIGGGHYYVDGILCENEAWTSAEGRYYPTFYNQPDYSSDAKSNPLPKGNYLVYLDVWERLVTSYEDSSLREVALGGPDTAARAKVVWQIRYAENMPDGSALPTDDFNQDQWKSWVKSHWAGFNEWQPANRGMLKAKAREGSSDNLDACPVPPDARYRGRENQLYRVEIHRAGTAGTATFKWSRDNGSIIFPIRELNGTTAYLDHLGRDERLSLKEGDWVEVIDDRVIAQYQPDVPGRLVWVEKINLLDMTMILKTRDGGTLPTYSEDGPGHPILRRWDYRQREATETSIPEPADDGALLVTEDIWLTLENGLQIYFDSGFQRESGSSDPHFYGSGDHWMMPARTETGDVEWPKEIDDEGAMAIDNNGNPISRSVPPKGVMHHYAPLAIVAGSGITDVRNVFCPVQPCEPTATPRRRRG